MDSSKPHIANIFIQIEVFEESNGILVDQNKLDELGIKHKEKIVLKGFDQFELLKKLQAKLNNLKS
mgnify:FL=1